jgi:hypothetical protein
MSGSPAEEARSTWNEWARVQVHPGTGLVDRRGDTLLVVPAVPTSHHERVRELFELCHRPDLTGRTRVHALRALPALRPAAEMPGFAVLIRTGHTLRALVHGPVRILVDGRAPGQPGAGGGGRLVEHVLEDGAWHGVTVTAAGDAPGEAALADVLPLDLEAGTVPGAGVTLRRVPAGRAQQPPAAETPEASAATGVPTSSTALRPAVQFRTVLLGECAVRAPGGQGARVRRRPAPGRPDPRSSWRGCCARRGTSRTPTCRRARRAGHRCRRGDAG